MSFTRFLHFIVRQSQALAWLIVAIGVVSGLMSAGVLMLVNHVLHQTSDRSSLVIMGFIGLVLGKILSNMVSQLMLVRLAQDTILDLSLALCSKIVRAPLRRSEQHGAANVLATLTDDVGSLTWAIQCFPQLVMNSAIVAGCGAYLAWLSLPTFLGVMIMVAIGACGYRWLHNSVLRITYRAREARGELFQSFRSLTEGLKELLMHRERRDEFLEQSIRRAAEEYRRTNLEATQRQALSESWTQLSFYLLIGLVVFLFPNTMSLSPETVTGYVFAVLYMMGPVWGIIGALPAIARGQVALASIERLGVSLDQSEGQGQGLVHPWRPICSAPVIEMEGATFQYDTEGADDRRFVMGPLSLTLRAGSLVFVIGGNGSGKSTFAKVLSGLYYPQKGTLRLDGADITEESREWYREHFSVVFSDFHVFATLHGLSQERIDAVGSDYLRMLQIDHVVTLKDRTFSTVALSQGQRKRLALATAYLEDRPVYVFDEWAADQDPQYKEVFYKSLLPDLRERGKLVVVITHDDRYFHLGDQIIKLEDGKVVQCLKTVASNPQPL